MNFTPPRAAWKRLISLAFSLVLNVFVVNGNLFLILFLQTCLPNLTILIQKRCTYYANPYFSQLVFAVC